MTAPPSPAFETLPNGEPTQAAVAALARLLLAVVDAADEAGPAAADAAGEDEREFSLTERQ